MSKSLLSVVPLSHPFLFLSIYLNQNLVWKDDHYDSDSAGNAVISTQRPDLFNLVPVKSKIAWSSRNDRPPRSQFMVASILKPDGTNVSNCIVIAPLDEKGLVGKDKSKFKIVSLANIFLYRTSKFDFVTVKNDDGKAYSDLFCANIAKSAQKKTAHPSPPSQSPIVQTVVLHTATTRQGLVRAAKIRNVLPTPSKGASVKKPSKNSPAVSPVPFPDSSSSEPIFVGGPAEGGALPAPGGLKRKRPENESSDQSTAGSLANPPPAKKANLMAEFAAMSEEERDEFRRLIGIASPRLTTTPGPTRAPISSPNAVPGLNSPIPSHDAKPLEGNWNGGSPPVPNLWRGQHPYQHGYSQPEAWPQQAPLPGPPVIYFYRMIFLFVLFNYCFILAFFK